MMRRWLGICLVVIGLGIGLYNFWQWYGGQTAAQDLSQEEVQAFTEEDGNKAEQAPSPSPSQPDTGIQPPQPQSLSESESATEPKLEPEPVTPAPILTSDTEHALGAEAATLLIPEIEQKYTVYWGTDEDVLSQGVGLYVSDTTTVPGSHGHTVMSGHRDTVFTRLGELEVADQLLVEYNGQKFTYEISKIWITHKDDRTVIVEKDEPTLTLTTCYPFNFFGDAPDRYIIQAKLITD